MGRGEKAMLHVAGLPLNSGFEATVAVPGARRGMTMRHRIFKPTLLSLVLGAALQNMAFAQQQPEPGATPPEQPAEARARELDAVVVVGSRLATTRTEGPSPVVVLDEEKIEATGAISGDELLQAIPQVGDMMFNNTD